jgi:ankyrin repeat protein
VRRRVCVRRTLPILATGFCLFSAFVVEAKQPEQWAPVTDLSQEAYYGRTEQLTTLIADGGDVNEQDEAERTALMWAALGAEPECASLLIEAGADSRLQEAYGYTALMCATGLFGHNVPQKGSWNEEARTSTLRLLLESGVDVDARSKGGETALFFAVRAGSLERIVLLLDAGADVNTTSTIGWTPLMCACQSGSEAALMRELIHRGADVNAAVGSDDQWWAGYTPLRFAREAGNSVVVELLLAAGATE